MSSKETMIVAWQAETHVYAGNTGYVVIMQKDEMGEESTIFLDPQNVAAVIDALRVAAPRAVEFRASWLKEGDHE